MRSEFTILSPIHLGIGQTGRDRKQALEQLASESNCYWNDRPSIGRYLKKIAEAKMTAQKITINKQTFTAFFKNDHYRVFSAPREWFSGRFDCQTGRFSGTKKEDAALVAKLREALGLSRQYKAVTDSKEEQGFDDEGQAIEWLADNGGGNLYDLKLQYRCSGVGADGGGVYFRPDGSAGY